MYKKLICSMTLVLVLGLAGTTAQAEPNVIPTDWSVAAQWHFDEGSPSQTVSDSSGNGWNGFLGDSASTTTYDPTWTTTANAGPYALDFEPVDGVIIPLLGGRHPAAGADGVMVDVWIKPESLSNYATVVSASDDSATDRYAIWLFADGRVRFASAGVPITAPAGTIVTGQWYHIVGVYDDRGDALGYSELYIDGVKVTSWYEHIGSLTNSSDNTELVIGWYYPETTQYRYDGVIDELTISVPGPAPDPGVAWKPDPADEWVISGKDKDSATLSWSSGAYAATHDVYLGTDFNDVNGASRLAGDVDGNGPVDWNDIEIVAKQWLQDPPCASEPSADVNDDGNVNLADFAVVANDWMAGGDAEFIGNQDTNSYGPGSLELYTTYYWRVEEVNNCDGNSPWKGDIWSFDVVNMTRQDFEGGAGQTPYATRVCAGGSAPAVVSGALRIVNGVNQQNSVVFDQNDANGLYGRIVAEWDASVTTGKEGYGFALLNTAVYGTSGAGTNTCINWDEPSAANSFGVGFDIYSPDDIYNFGEYEVSLHWAGRERANVRSPFDFRTGTFEPVRVEVDFVTGGANVSVNINGLSVYTDYFLAGMTPYDSRVAFGARTGTSASATVYLDNIEVAFKEPISVAPDPPVTVQTFVQEHIYGAEVGSIYWKAEAFFDFPACGTTYGRVVLRLILDEPVGGSDPVDRLLRVDVWDGAEQYEISRIATPYGKPGLNWTWWIDVTDYQWLLCGNRKVRISPGFDKGWLVTTDFDFYEGTPEYLAYRAENLWVGTPNYGECSDTSGLGCAGQGNPIDAFFVPSNITIDPNADRVKLRFVLTGHGENHDPQGSAAEFLKRGRTVDVNNGSDYDLLWRDDCYLNPCRDQRITNWRYSRAGWCPADVVWPWEIDITDDVTPGANATIYYQADEYILDDANDYYMSNPSRHSVESQIIYYKKP